MEHSEFSRLGLFWEWPLSAVMAVSRKDRHGRFSGSSARELQGFYEKER